jgi:hypothetical protein
MLKNPELRPGVIAHASNLSYSGGIDWRIVVPSQPGQKHETLPEKQTLKTKGLGCGSSSKASA